MEKRLYINQDNHQFYLHPTEDMSVEGCRALVDYYAETGTVKGILFCTNVQRALYDSEVWERFSDIEDPDPLVQNLKVLSRRKVDYFGAWLERCREVGIEGWLTMRMNDCHGLDCVCHNIVDHFCYKWPSVKWRTREDLRRAPYRSERSWESAYNFMLEEVREHHLSLVREILQKWDMYGLELDWERWGMMLPPGSETEGQEVLTAFVRQVRALMDEAETRVGHKIRLAHRVLHRIDACLDSGFDVITWAREGMADMLTLGAWGTDSIPHAKVWRNLVPEGTILNICNENSAAIDFYPGHFCMSPDILAGITAAIYEEGYDHCYLFNDCYREGDSHEEFHDFLKRLGSPEKLSRMYRRLPFTNTTQYPGSSVKGVLPILLDHPWSEYEYARMEQNISLKFPYAGKSGDAYLVVGFSKETVRESVEDMPARMNTVLLERGECTEAEPFYMPFQSPDSRSEQVGFYLSWKIPAGILHPGGNVAELLPEHVPGKVMWAELMLLPSE